MNVADLPVAVQEFLKKTNSDLISVTDVLGKIVYTSSQFADLTKYTQDELYGENHRLIKSNDQPQELFDELWYDISHGKIWSGVLKNRAKDGSYFSVYTTITPIVGKSPRETCYVAVRKLVEV